MEEQPRSSRPGRVLRTVVPACLAVFLADLWTPPNVAVGILYIIPVLISPWVGRRRFTLAVAGSCTLLVLVGLGLPVSRAAEGLAGATGSPGDLTRTVANAAMAVFAIWVTANLSLLRTAVERKLKDGRDTFATTLGSIADAVVTTDEEGAVTFVNQAAEELLGETRDALLGRPLDEVVDWLGERLPENDSAVFEGPPGLASQPWTLRRRDGIEIPIDQSIAPVHDAEGRFRGRVIVFRDMTERREHELAIRRLAYRDPLTGLPNRTSLWDRLGLEVAHARREGQLLALCFLDLDGFKAVNDTLGHRAGDDLLCEVARRLAGALREGDTVARLAGDEFTILLPGLSRGEDAARVADKLLDALEPPVRLGDQELRVRASIGIAVFPQDAGDGEALLQRADEAMYASKERGGNTWTFRAPPSKPSREPVTAL